MTGSGGGSDRTWVSRWRDGILLGVGVGLLIFEAAGNIFGHSADPLIVGAALALIGVVPVLQKEGK